MKKLSILPILMISSFISFSQTTTGEGIKPDKIVKDTLNGKTYWMWETPKAKVIAKDLEKGLINSEKVNALEKKITIMEEKNKMCENTYDTLKLAYEKANKIIENQGEIINNNGKIISNQNDISNKKDEIISKQAEKIVRKNGLIKTLVGTNIGTALVILIILL